MNGVLQGIATDDKADPFARAYAAGLVLAAIDRSEAIKLAAAIDQAHHEMSARLDVLEAARPKTGN
jgi:hypothetical protein